MAVIALFFHMGSGQCKTCKFMVKGFFPEPDDLEILPVVITVACYTALAVHIRRGMVAFILTYAGLQFGMAFQAFRISHLVAQCMAFDAGGDPFQV